MEAKALTPRDLFDGRVCYEIPPFQRPYVWTEEDQWQPLWDDIARVVSTYLDGDGAVGNHRHFLGAVVVKQLPSSPGEPNRYWVIDGQQRLTTLQLLLDAAQLIIEQLGHEDHAETLHELVVNAAGKFARTPKRFKLWPSRIDREAFEQVMDNSMVVATELAESPIVQAHHFFISAIDEWATLDGEDESSPTEERLGALAAVLERHLQLVAIVLDHDDDDQLIFETLNDRGTPLLAADLIKNFVFQRCEDIGIDVDDWSEKYWQEFDDSWWRGQVAQGRLYRSRIDLFLQYWLTMRLGEEVPTDAVFARFRTYATPFLEEPAPAQEFIAALRRDADTFRSFADLDPLSLTGQFYERVVEAMELGAFIPLLLWLVSANHNVPPAESGTALRALESWTVRRVLLRRTMKNVNKLAVALLKELDVHSVDKVGDVVVGYLANQTADAQEWPTDQEVRQELPAVKVYGNIKQPRLRAVLAAVERHYRDERSEDVSIPDRLEIEHVMPRGWRSHWGAGVVGDLEATARRDRLVNCIGNLTLVTKKLNVVLSNRPWRNDEAIAVAPTGKDAGLGKWALLNRYSLLVLNKQILDRHPDAWTEADIEDRCQAMVDAIVKIWPGA